MNPIPKRAVLRPLKGVRILSLALNLPGPAALMRCHAMGARCVKLEPPPHPSTPGGSGDPMYHYNPSAYSVMHEGIALQAADLKTTQGQARLHRLLAHTDILLTSFRPSALKKLNIQWSQLRTRYPQLSMVCIVGALGARAEEPGHDLTYVAQHDLITGLDLPATLYADMAGSLMTTEAILQVRMQQLRTGKGVRAEVALSSAAEYLALPRAWGLTQAGAAVGGGHAGYRIYACKDGRVALAALEPHFATALGQAAGLSKASLQAMFEPASHAAIAAFAARHTRAELEQLSARDDIPLLTLPPHS